MILDVLCVCVLATGGFACVVPPWLDEVRVSVPNTSHCLDVFVTVALFPDRPRGWPGRVASATERSKLPLIHAPRGCAVAFVTSNVALHHAARSDWIFSTVNLESNITSNEVQRRAHAIRTFAPFLFPMARDIHYGDVKCQKNNIFPSASFQRLAASTTCPIRTLKHPQRFGHALHEEFSAVVRHMRVRKESQEVFDDIEKTRKVCGRLGVLDLIVSMPDSMCVSFAVSSKSKELSCRWTQAVCELSMRVQLTFNLAVLSSGLEECGCSLRFCATEPGVAYIPFGQLTSLV